MTTRHRWIALSVLCLGTLMIVLDTTIVNVALPSIQSDLGFSQASLAWVVNAYLLTFGGFLLLGGRLGDLYGHRKLFMIGIAVFTLASLGCAVSVSQGMLISLRAIQGVGGAIASAVSLSLMVNLFTDPTERAKAMGVFGFVAAGGGSVGVVLGGFLTEISWHWIFLINVPIGLAVLGLSRRLLPDSDAPAADQRLDVAGAITVTAALMLAVYAIVGGNAAGWTSAKTLGCLAGAVALGGVFLWIESHTRSPLMPLRLFRLRNLATANVVGVLWAAGMFAWFFLSSLYLQKVLGYKPKGRRPRVPARQPRDDGDVGRRVGKARAALRAAQAARDRSRARRARAAAARARPGRRRLLDRRPAEHGPARPRRRDWLQPRAAGRHG